MANSTAQQGDPSNATPTASAPSAVTPAADIQGAGATARPATRATKAARQSPGNADVTRLDGFNDKPSVTAPGDGPADTTDPAERATTVGGNQLAAAQAGHLTVNAAVPVATTDDGRLKGVAISYPGEQGDSTDGTGTPGPRIERYPATRPNGQTVTVEHNIDTGITRIV